MLRLRLVLAAVLAASALAVLAGPASAATPAAGNSKFCTAVSKIGSQNSASKPTKAQAQKLISQFKAAAKSAPPKVKAAIGKITKYLGIITGGNVSDIADLAKSGDYTNYTKAIGTYTTYVATHC